jgi:hypothetical protein
LVSKSTQRHSLSIRILWYIMAITVAITEGSHSGCYITMPSTHPRSRFIISKMKTKRYEAKGEPCDENKISQHSISPWSGRRHSTTEMFITCLNDPAVYSPPNMWINWRKLGRCWIIKWNSWNQLNRRRNI